MIIDVRREIIHAAGNINELPVAQTLTHFFNGAMNISKMRFNFFDGFAIQCNHQMQYAMRGRMLWSHIDDEITVHIRCAVDECHLIFQFLCT